MTISARSKNSSPKMWTGSKYSQTVMTLALDLLKLCAKQFRSVIMVILSWIGTYYLVLNVAPSFR